MATRLGDKLKSLRKEKELTLEKLAELSGLSKSYIWELENRESQRPSAEKLNALGKVLGVDSVFFIEDDIRAPEQRHLDAAFYRDYQDLEVEDKERLRKIMETFKKS